MDSFIAACQNSICFFVNGKRVLLNDPDPEISLLYYLRRKLRLTGTKQGCNEGGCGLCTVMISKYDPVIDQIKHSSVTACLVSICSLDGVAVTTIEGIGSTKAKLHPCQERIARCHGSQCGFCTPGMVMSMYTLLRNNPQPTEKEMEASLRGNLCRCTGYRPILDSFRTFCKDCTYRSDVNKKMGEALEFESIKIDPTQEPIFPPELILYSSTVCPLSLKGPRCHWYTPVTLEQLLLLADNYLLNGNENKIVAGNISTQICQVNGLHPAVVISVDSVPELKTIQSSDNGLVVGAAITLSELEAKLQTVIESTPDGKCKVFRLILEALTEFGSPQIRNKVTIGSISMGLSAISDVLPILMVSEAKRHIASINRRRESTLLISTKDLSLDSNEVLVSVCIPYSQEDEYMVKYKQARRKHIDAAIVGACMKVKVDGSLIKDCSLLFCSFDKIMLATKTMEAIVQCKWDDSVLQRACKSLLQEIVIPGDSDGGMVDYRRVLCLSFFQKFFLFVQNQLSSNSLSSRVMSALQPLPSGPSKGSQGFHSVPSSQPLWDSIGRPMMHLSALEQATGEAKFVNDLPVCEGELFAGFVLSDCAHGTFTVDTSSLDGMKGIQGFVSAKDVPGSNKTGLLGDEKLFADGEVTAVGQIIGIVVAEDLLTAQRAAKSVKVSYNELPKVLTIEEAIAANQFFQPERNLKCGDVQKGLAEAEHCCEGEMRIGGQEHFYMETCSCVCIPKGEKGEMEIISSTQELACVQNFSSRALGVPANRITAKVKRIGGAFGGKEVRCNVPYAAVAIAANKFQSPVRAVLERGEDMMNTGGRDPFKGIYKVGFNDSGEIQALDIDFYSNAGYSSDLSTAVIESAILQIQSVYKIPNMKVRGRACCTNLPSNTAARGFGKPQALLIMESILTRIADTLGIDRATVQETNLLQDGDRLVCGLIVENCTIRRCWNTLKEKCCYNKKKAEVQEFNKANKWKKRGLSLVPTQLGLGMELLFVNQAGALVHIYTDGSVRLAHGGIEMGQGLDTKMVQVCSKCLSVPVDKVYIQDSSTDKVPNATATAASVSSDYYGMAIKNACEQLNERLKPFKEAEPDAGWEAWVHQAYMSRVNLSAQGFYKPDGIWIDWETGTGKPYLYYSYGVGCSVVEVDTLTGEYKILSTDLLMDVGNSLNPAIDIGQIEGAFMQGVGLFTMEECVFLRDGRMHTVGPKTYKIPGCSDIPIELNVTLLDRCPNPKAIFSSKAIGEPPLFLAGSVFFAIRDAVKSARSERDITGSFKFWSPATVERIRMACGDEFVDMVQHDDGMNLKEASWNISP